MNYKEAEDFLYSLVDYEKTPRLLYDYDLERFKNFLKRLGEPHKKLKRVILVAGTKGKGSICTFIETVLRSSGLSTGLFTSPHLFSFRERVRVNNRMISKEDFARIMAIIAPEVDEKTSFFETLTAMAFLYFVEKRVDYAVLEVGLGGRLDTTNVVEPLVSVIATIGLDHTEILGDTLEEIAKEKAGIIREKGITVSSPQKLEALRVIKERARERLVLIGRDLKIEREDIGINGSRFILSGDFGEMELSIPVLGAHQVINAATSVGTLIQLRDSRITPSSIKRGFRKARLRARCEVVKREPWILVDGAHNPDSISALRRFIEDVFPNRKIKLIFGILRKKLIREVLEIILPITGEVILTKVDNPRAESLERLKEMTESYGISPGITHSLEEALSSVLPSLSSKDILVITGSLYLAAEALKLLREGSRF